MKEQRQHLHRLAKPHVIGKTGTDAEPHHEVQPVHAVALIRPQRGFEIGMRGDFIKTRWVAKIGEQPIEPRSRLDARPFAGVVTQHLSLTRLNPRTGKEAHGLKEGHAPAELHGVGLTPVIEHRFELVGISFHPAAFDQNESFGGLDGL